jgi:uridine kinase
MHTSTGCFVIAVAGPSGAGKSTLVKELVRELKDAVALYFDDYHPGIVSSTSYPKDLAQWLAEGANPDSWATPQMIADLQALLNGETIASPDNKSVLRPATFIVMEEPFGRARTPLKKLVNYVIAINTPLEVALARRLLREAEKPYFKEHPDEFGSSMLNYLHIYLEIARPLYLAANEHVHKDCNLVLDGLKPLPEIVDEAAKQVRIAASLLPVRSE